MDSSMTILLITAITGGLFYVEMASITLFPALYADICKKYAKWRCKTCTLDMDYTQNPQIPQGVDSNNFIFKIEKTCMFTLTYSNIYTIIEK